MSANEERARSRVMLHAIACAAVLIALQVAGKATRDALYLSTQPVTTLPAAMTASAVLSIIAVLASSRVLSRFGPAKVIPVAFLLNGVLLAIEAAFGESAREAIAVIVYLQTSVFGALLISGFWSVINERFDPHSARGAVARINAGAAFGGIVGGLLAQRGSTIMGVIPMLFALAAGSAACAFLVSRIASPIPSRAREPVTRTFSGLSLLKDVPYLRNLSILVLLISTTSGLLDYILKAEASARMQDDASLLSFFALFYTITGALTFLVQTFISRRALDKLGLTGTVALLPAAVALFGIVGAVATRLWSAVATRAAEAILSNSLFRSGYEVLFTPVDPEQKRSTKTIIDVAIQRIGDAAAGGVVVLVILVAPAFASSALLAICAVTSVLAIFVTRTLHRGYVHALAEGLRSGTLQLEDESVVDATTRRTLSETIAGLSRTRLLEDIQRFRAGEGDSDASVAAAALLTSFGGVLPINVTQSDPVLATIARLRSSSAKEITEALREKPEDPRVLVHVIPLLARADVQTHAVAALREASPRIVGLLVDALLDPAQSSVVRRRIPSVLAMCNDARAVDGLMRALSGPSFGVRYRSGRALLRIVQDEPALRPPKDVVYEAVVKELRLASGTDVPFERLKLGAEETARPSGHPEPDEAGHRLEHVFTLLSVALDRETLSLALRALSSGDLALRGTALEYLENVLPDHVRSRLWPHLGSQPRPAPPVKRPAEAVVDELLRSMDGGPHGKNPRVVRS